jgi:hypothetical protein
MAEARAPGPDDRPQHPVVPAVPGGPPVQPLAYAQPSSGRPPRLPFRETAGLFAVLGIFANCFFVERAIASVHEAHLAHFRLDRFPSAFGREIDADVIASLARPVGLWVSSAAFGAAAIAGLPFAVRMLIAVVRLNRDEKTSLARLEHYATWKPAGR